MTPSTISESVFFGPLTPDWTIGDLLEWIGADDGRCHDGRLLPVVNAASRALGSRSTPFRGGAVAGVRFLVSQVAADRTVGERRLGDLAGRQETAERVLVSA